MTDKQIIIDYKNLCKNYSKEVGCYYTFDGSCNKEQCFTYMLLQLLQDKEQECEELKKIINGAKNSKLDLKSFLVGEAVQNEYEQQLDQLKQTLTEIKDIAENEIECKTYEIENDCFNETRCKALNEHIDFTKQILQKISECEVKMNKAEQILMIAIICYKNAQKHFKKQMKNACIEQEIEVALKEFEPIFNRLVSEVQK